MSKGFVLLCNKFVGIRVTAATNVFIRITTAGIIKSNSSNFVEVESLLIKVTPN